MQLGVIIVRCGDGIMQDVERHVKCSAMWCKIWCDARCGGTMHNVANICDLKCGVEYRACGIMWNVM